ncbi:hypothetical protein Gasu2_65620 [Galdieria sulphuraria]|nr:hypothetical protein Gasu2_65620 [Galdieria sulphuraria]
MKTFSCKRNQLVKETNVAAEDRWFFLRFRTHETRFSNLDFEIQTMLRNVKALIEPHTWNQTWPEMKRIVTLKEEWNITDLKLIHLVPGIRRKSNGLIEFFNNAPFRKAREFARRFLSCHDAFCNAIDRNLSLVDELLPSILPLQLPQITTFSEKLIYNLHQLQSFSFSVYFFRFTTQFQVSLFAVRPSIEESTCGICVDEIAAHQLPCHHNLCEQCLLVIQRGDHLCPFCRQDIWTPCGKFVPCTEFETGSAVNVRTGDLYRPDEENGTRFPDLSDYVLLSRPLYNYFTSNNSLPSDYYYYSILQRGIVSISPRRYVYFLS